MSHAAPENPYVAKHLAQPRLHAICLSLAILQATLSRRFFRARTSATATTLTSTIVSLPSFVPFTCKPGPRHAQVPLHAVSPSHAYLCMERAPNDMTGPASLWAGFPCHLPSEKALLAERMRNSPRLMMAFTLGCRFILPVILVAMQPGLQSVASCTIQA